MPEQAEGMGTLPKRHAGEVQHLLDCPPDEPFPYVPGAVVKYRGKMGLSWLAWAGLSFGSAAWGMTDWSA